jgi:hypothetical protein
VTAGRLTWGIVVLAVGGLLLAANFGAVSWGFLASLWQLWPLILILIGLGMLFRRSNPYIGALVMILVIGAGVGLAWAAWNGNGFGSLNDYQITSVPATQVSSAEAQISMGASKLTLHGNVGNQFVSGVSRSRQKPDVSSSSSGGTFQFQLDQNHKGFPGFTFSGHEEIDLGLAPNVPWDIRINSGAADMQADLTQVTLRSFTLKTGASSLNLRVGNVVTDGASIQIDGGAASFDLSLPTSLNISVHTSTGLTSQDFGAGFTKQSDGAWVHQGGGSSLTVDVKAGVSSLNVKLY